MKKLLILGLTLFALSACNDETSTQKSEEVAPKSTVIDDKASIPPTQEQLKNEEQVETTAEAKEESKEPKEEKSNEPAQTIGINIKQFSQRANAALAEMGSPYKMGTKLKTEKGKVNDVVSYQFSKNFGIIVSIDKKTQNVVSLLTIVTPEANKAESNMVMMFSNAAVLSAFEGKNQLKTVGKQIMETTSDVMRQYAENKEDASKEFIFNGKKYSVNVSSYTGIMSSAGFAK